MRLYISGPITGVKHYKSNFNDAQRMLEQKGYSVINPAMLSEVVGNDLTYEQYMFLDMDLINLCGGIVLLPGWERSLGCNREYGYAFALDKLIFKLEDFVDA